MTGPDATTPQLVIGTAGHIDHGKSRLVWALTGTDPDRLPEEQARGMTIDLGFAHAEVDGCALHFVDVPGHERFIRNMVAGATGVDVALLVVAADDSVMPQTREHAEVLALLGVRRVVLVLTKVDLVDDEWAAQVAAEAGELLTSLGLTPVAEVRTSAVTGRGLDELRQVLAGLARQRAAADGPTWFRLPIDRAFTVAGRGTVVTGSVLHGAVRSGDELELWPAGTRVRVRDLETHHTETAAAAGRMRLAVNLAGVAREEVGRGCELATPGYLTPATRLDVQLDWLRLGGRPRTTWRVRIHLATLDVLAELRLLDAPDGPHVRAAPAQLKTARPVVAAWGQRFIVRDEAGQRTLGGGVVLRPVAAAWTARQPAERAGLAALHSGAAAERLEEVIRAGGWQPATPAGLAARAGLADAEASGPLLARLRSRGRVQVLEGAGTPAVVHVAHLEALKADVAARLARFLADRPRVPGVPRVEWGGWLPRACPARLHGALTDWLVRQGGIVVENERVLPAGREDRLGDADRALLDAALAELEAGRFAPPAPGALVCRTPRNGRRLDELLAWAAARGRVVEVAEGVVFHAACWAELVATVGAALRERGRLTVAEIRTLLGSSRKYVVPTVERLDALGVTQRSGDYRTAGPNAGG